MHSIPRPAITFFLLLFAAGLVLAGGVWLARRQVEERVPADRALLRESGAALQGELARLDVLLTGHLRKLTDRLEAGESPEILRAACGNVRGVALYGVLSIDVKTPPRMERLPEPGSLPPEPELTAPGKSTSSPFKFAISRETVFGNSLPPDERKGWISERKAEPVWIAWWRRLNDDRRVAVFILRRRDLQTAVNAQLSRLLPAVWSPVRAAGGLDRLEAPERRVLAGLSAVPEKPPDFVIPLASRFGDWQMLSWDRRETRVKYDFLTVSISGVLAVCLTALGAVTAAMQRRALREVTARVSFVNRVSHELAAPLTNLQLSLELARDALPEGTPPDAARRLDVALEESARLRRLTDNVLIFARRGRERPAWQTVSRPPAEVVAGVLEQFAPALARRGVAVESILDEDAAFVSDADALAQITANLVSNVEKYASSGGLLRVELFETTDAARRLVLRMSDRGPGVPAAEAERIFLPFERLDSRLTEGVSGAGLGLSIARDLARRLGGDVSLRDAGGSVNGAVFELSLPVPASTGNGKPDWATPPLSLT